MIKVDTARVMESANRISNTNKALRNDFDDVAKQMNELRRCWEGAAADRMSNTFQHIKMTLPEQRYLVVESMANFLRRQVSGGYDETEKAILAAAQMFK